ncbi:MAG: hypothetical protein FWE74_03900 [Oscillospiraceae bacterium]|nr:hypothetical protein [Oscillospiraceae bacterium]
MNISFAPMTSMFTKTQNQKREASFYARTINNKADIKNNDKQTPPLNEREEEKNTDRFDDSNYKCEHKEKREDTERTFAMLYRELESTKIKGSTMFVMAKCIRIAQRIQRGDNVPLKDDKFLYDNYPEMHLKAWMLRRFKEDPEDHKSELDDEDCGSGGVKFTIMAGSASFDFGGTADIATPEINIS